MAVRLFIQVGVRDNLVDPVFERRQNGCPRSRSQTEEAQRWCDGEHLFFIEERHIEVGRRGGF